MSLEDVTKEKRVRVTNYSPFRGLKGTVVRVNRIEDEGDDPFCFYLIALDSLREPLWFEYDEVELIDAPLFSEGRKMS